MHTHRHQYLLENTKHKNNRNHSIIVDAYYYLQSITMHTNTMSRSPQSIFEKEAVFYLVIIVLSIFTIGVTSNSITNSASILSNYRYQNKYRVATTRNTAISYRRDVNSINLWNVRSLSTLQLSAQPPTTAIVGRRRRSGGSFGINEVASVKAVKPFRLTRRSGIPRRLHNRNSWDSPHGDQQNRKFTNNVMDASSSITNQNDPEYEPSLAEMRAQLGPIGLMIANAVEVGIATAGSYMSGGIFGYMIGGFMGVPNLFKDSTSTGLQMPPPPATNQLGGELQRRVGHWNSKALAQGKSWASLSASFSGFHALTRVCRGGVEDRWNSIIGSACAGAYLSREG